MVSAHDRGDVGVVPKGWALAVWSPAGRSPEAGRPAHVCGAAWAPAPRTASDDRSACSFAAPRGGSVIFSSGCPPGGRAGGGRDRGDGPGVAPSPPSGRPVGRPGIDTVRVRRQPPAGYHAMPGVRGPTSRPAPWNARRDDASPGVRGASVAVRRPCANPRASARGHPGAPVAFPYIPTVVPRDNACSFRGTIQPLLAGADRKTSSDNESCPFVRHRCAIGSTKRLLIGRSTRIQTSARPPP